jgi:nucleoside-diphosphate kinase
MAGNRTFTMIKPDAVRAGNIGNILQMINAAGYRIVAMKLTQLSPAKAGEFYAVHKERPFYGELCEFMSSGPIVAAILEKDNAVEDFPHRRYEPSQCSTWYHSCQICHQRWRKCSAWLG